jgi:peptidoglycan glycosyltransferase
MNRELKALTRVVIAMFLALFVATSLVQVVYADSLRADPRNVRTLYDSYSAQRGSILVDGTPIAYSSPVNDVYRYQRIYADGEMYAPITGYFTLNQGITGIEGA